MALIFILDGIWRFFSGGSFNGLWLASIGWFLIDAAKANQAEAEISDALRDLRVSQVMSCECTLVNRGMRLQDFVYESLVTTGDRCFAVEDHGDMVGIVIPPDVVKIPRARWTSTTVGDAMRPLEQLRVITPDTPVVDALKLMARNAANQLPVVTNGTLQGIVSRSQLMQPMAVRSELGLPVAYSRSPSTQDAGMAEIFGHR